MTRDRTVRLESVVLQAAALAPEARRRFLDEACRDDPEMRRKAEEMLARDGEAAGNRHEPDPSTGPKSPSGLIPGEILAGRFRIDHFIARGGMGAVYRATDLDLKVTVALKTIRPEIASSPVFLRRFKQEVLLARSITHPNVCRIYDLGRDETKGVSFLTMEYLVGESLDSRIQSETVLAPEAALPLVRQLADALDAAHRAGIIHRDFKSANVMLVPAAGGERAVITDFGLAVAMGDEESEALEALADPSTPPVESARDPGDAPGRFGGPAGDAVSADGRVARLDRPFATSGRDLSRTLAAESEDSIPLSQSNPRARTQRGHVVGTLGYMSPEQMRGGEVGPASDLYSLGVVLFEMTTGQLPFGGTDLVEMMRARTEAEPPSPSAIAPVAPDWERVILRLLSREPSERFSSARDVVWALEGRLKEEEGSRCFLPAERDAFVGRRGELDLLASFLESAVDEPAARSVPVLPAQSSSASRLLNLLGLGGSGKTRLALRYGWESLPRWPGGVWFCDLSEARGVEGIALAVASALNVPLGKVDPIVQLGHAIAGRGNCLLILDNFEQVAEHAESTLSRWIERAPKARFMVTSRERLGLPGETIHQLEPLDPSTYAMNLFEVRAREHRPGFRVDEENRDLVREIVSVLDGLPLAIELAASRLRMLSLQALRDRLDHRFRILAGGKRRRHSTLRATFDWSWDLLKPWECSAVEQASVFEGGFTLEAAEAVIDLSAHPAAPSVLDVIQSLVDKSWLRARVALQAPRFEMYATAQEYASERLRLPGVTAGEMGGPPPAPAGASPDQEAERRHGLYYAAMGTEGALALLDRHGGVMRRAALRLEIGNLVAACRRAAARAEADIAVATLASSCEVFNLTGPFAASVNLAEVVRGIPGMEPAPLARACRILGSSLVLVGRKDEAWRRLEEALSISRGIGDRKSAGTVLGEMANLLSDQGRIDETLGKYEEALSIFRELAERKSEAIILRNSGSLYRMLGRIDEAQSRFEQALAILREVGDRKSEGMTLGSLASLNLDQGRMEESRRQFEESLAIHREVGNRVSEGVVLGNLGNLHSGQGRMEEARRHYEDALAIHREVGNRRAEGVTLGNLGSLDLGQGRMDEARRHHEEALAIHREVGDRRFEGGALGNLGNLHKRQGRTEEARKHFEEVLAILREVGDRKFEGVTLGNLGNLYFSEHRWEEARSHYEAALAIHREVGDRGSEGTALGHLGNLYLSQGKTEEAHHHIDAGVSILRDSGDRLDLARLLCTLVDCERQRGDIPAARSGLTEAEAIAATLALTPESDLARDIAELRERLEEGGGG